MSGTTRTWLEKTRPWALTSFRFPIFSTLRSPRLASSFAAESSPSPRNAVIVAAYPQIPKQHLIVPLPDDCQILKLSNGRLMSYGDYGSRAPNARTFLFFHGIPDCRLDACLMPSDHALAEKLNIRWIGMDRPGMGLSTYRAGHTILDWVEDLKELISHLKLDSYHLFSVSGGTAHALAAAKLLPREKVRSVGIMVGVAPVQAGTAGMSLLNRIGYAIWRYSPGVFLWIFERQVVPVLQQESPAKAEEMMRKQAKYLPKEDREEFSKPGAVEAFAKLWRESHRQGARGYVEDSKLSTAHWGFEVQDVGYPGVKLHYGGKDVNTPPNMGKYLAARLPNAVYNEFPGKSHFTMWDHIEEILTDMLED